MPPTDPSHACVCSIHTSTSPGLAPMDADSKLAGSAKRKALGDEDASDPKACRHCATPSQPSNVRQMQLMIELANPKHRDLVEIEHNVPNRTMGRQQARRGRDSAVATIMRQSNRFDVSTRTFILAIKILDNFLEKTVTVVHNEARTASQGESNGPVQHPLACFTMACKFCETFAPRLTDVCDFGDGARGGGSVVEAAGSRCTVQELRIAENDVLAVLCYDIGIVTAIDVMHKLLGLTTARRAAHIRAKAEKSIRVSCCSFALSKIEATDMAVASLLYACDDLAFGEEYLDFVPRFMMTEKTHDLKDQVKAFIALNVEKGESALRWK